MTKKKSVAETKTMKSWNFPHDSFSCFAENKADALKKLQLHKKSKK